ncbi:MAG: hypothetical protein L0211_26810 [Planctomycetaceae bacterium]|nr:hypothetical protein [Planctomycetaceae bacterium]
MQMIDVQQLQENAQGVIAAAQKEEILVVRDGVVVAVVSRPRRPADFSKYWEERELRLAGIDFGPDWDSTQIISEDRDR